MTHRTEQQHRVDRALARVLLNVGDYLLPERALRDEITLVLHPPSARAEIDEAIRHADNAGRLTAVRGEIGLKYKLNDAGRAWASENL